MRLHSKFTENSTQLIYELIWYSDFHKMLILVNKVSPTSIPKQLSFDSFYNEYSELVN